MNSRHIVPGFFAGWQITNPEGQHTAHVDGSQQDAVERAHRQLEAVGGGQVVVDEHDL